MTDPTHDTAPPSAAAEPSLREQLQADPARHDVALALGGLLLGDGRVDEAVALLREHVADRACGDLLREFLVGERRNEEALALVANRPGAASASVLVDRAIAAHVRGDIQGAIRYCDLAITTDGGYAPAHNHRGRALFNARRADQARNDFIRAVRIAPDYAEAWHNLAHALRDAREFEQAEHAYGHALRLRPVYRSALLNRGVVRTALGRHEQALGDFHKLLALDPANAEVRLNAALCEHLLRRLDDARANYERAIALDPCNPRAHLQLGRLCNELFDTEDALRHFRGALDLNPRDTEAWSEIAAVYQQANRLEEAGRAVTAGLAVAPGDPGLQLEQARLDRRNGKAEAALARLRAIDPAHLHPRLQQPYQFELAWSLDRAGDHHAALPVLVKANALASRSPRAQLTDAGAFDRQLDAIDAWQARGAPAPDIEPGEDAGEDLCFLLGFPRSGTTLLDVMLDGHPDVASIEEKPTIESLAKALSDDPGGYPAAMASLDRASRDALRWRYRDAVAALLGPRLHGARRIVDKMPIRGIHAAFIHRLFPRARFLYSLRHPCDVVLSNFMQHYAANEVNVHFFTLAETVRVYDRAMRTLADARERLPLEGLDVRYEDLVADAPSVLRDACAFLDLPWHEHLADHQASLRDRPRIATSSYQQVYEPINARAVGRWHGYRHALEPFLPILRPHAERLGYAID